MNTTHALSVSNLTVAYDSAPVLDNVTFHIPAAKLAAIVGPNGAGKTTLMKTILGLLPPLGGQVLFFGQPRDKAMAKQIAYVPQSGSVDWDFPTTVIDVVMMGRYGHLGWFRHPKARERAAAMETLAMVGMADLAHRQIGRLSGGQQQRVFLARALIQQAELYLMDEPFKGVDAQTEAAIVKLLQALQQQGKTVIVVHHDLQTVAKYFDWVTLIHTRVMANGPCAQVLTEENLRITYGGSGLLGGGG